MSSFWGLCRGRGSSVSSRAASSAGEWEQARLPRASTPVGRRGQSAPGQASLSPHHRTAEQRRALAGSFLALAGISVCGC